MLKIVGKCCMWLALGVVLNASIALYAAIHFGATQTDSWEWLPLLEAQRFWDERRPFEWQQTTAPSATRATAFGYTSISARAYVEPARLVPNFGRGGFAEPPSQVKEWVEVKREARIIQCDYSGFRSTSAYINCSRSP